MIYDGDKEYYESDDVETVDNFDKLNEKYRNNIEWIVTLFINKSHLIRKKITSHNLIQKMLSMMTSTSSELLKIYFHQLKRI